MDVLARMAPQTAGGAVWRRFFMRLYFKHGAQSGSFFTHIQRYIVTAEQDTRIDDDDAQLVR
jgi:hypothetical protein